MSGAAVGRVNGGHFFALQFLLRKGADPWIAASDTRTALFAAAALSHHISLSIVDCLLDTAANQQVSALHSRSFLSV